VVKFRMISLVPRKLNTIELTLGLDAYRGSSTHLGRGCFVVRLISSRHPGICTKDPPGQSLVWVLLVRNRNYVRE
jgi:hypothetical protein